MVISQSFLVSKCILENGKLTLEVDRRGLCFYQSKDCCLVMEKELWLLMPAGTFSLTATQSLPETPAPITGTARE